MIRGLVRDNFPRLTLSIYGSGDPIYVDFLIDTGFEGAIALPDALLSHLNAKYAMDEFIRLADGTVGRRPAFEVTVTGTGLNAW